MAQISLEPIDDRQLWDRFLETHPESNFLQSWQWGQFHERLNHPIIRQGFYDGDQLVGIMLAVVEPARRARYLTVPCGPIIDWKNEELVQAFVTAVRRIALDQNCVFVRVRPQLISDQFSRELFKKLGFRSAPMHLHAELTHMLDVTQTDEQLMSGMRKGTKYEVKKSRNIGIKVTSSENSTGIQQFYDLQLGTARRQNFVPFSYKFFNEQFQVFTASGNALLYKAEFEGKLLAQAFVIFYGQEAVYHYGVSTPDGRKYPGAYAILWEAIHEARRRGMQRFNFWGVAPADQPNHRFTGVSVFKRGFGGEDVEYLHAQDLVINRPRYLVNQAIESLRKRRRHV